MENVEDQQSPDIDTTSYELTDNDIAGDPFTSDLDSILTTIGNFRLQKKPYQNIHNENQIDTILTIIFDNSSIEYYKGQSNGFILSAKINTDKIILKRGIRVGMDKKKFFQLFDQLRDDKINSVSISDFEGNQTVDFLFVNNRLVVVSFQGYFD